MTTCTSILEAIEEVRNTFELAGFTLPALIELSSEDFVRLQGELLERASDEFALSKMGANFVIDIRVRAIVEVFGIKVQESSR